MKLTARCRPSTSFMPTAWPAQAGAEIDLPPVKAKATIVGDDNGVVVEGIVRLRDAAVFAIGGRINLRRAFHSECLMRTLVVELVQEGVELGLLLQQIESSPKFSVN